jgi:hypothetical protein
VNVETGKNATPAEENGLEIWELWIGGACEGGVIEWDFASRVEGKL